MKSGFTVRSTLVEFFADTFCLPNGIVTFVLIWPNKGQNYRIKNYRLSKMVPRQAWNKNNTNSGFCDDTFTMVIYRFKLDQKQTVLLLDYLLEDKLSNVKNETHQIHFQKVLVAFRTWKYDLMDFSRYFLYIQAGMIADLLIDLAIYV